MYRWHSRTQEDLGLLRLLVQSFEATSDKAGDPERHAELLATFRGQLAELETREAQVFWRFSGVRRLVGSVLGRARAI
jgi:hypothetical protein